MARLFAPPLMPPTSRGLHAELQVLRTLEIGLSDAYTLLHSINFQHLGSSGAQRGELDIVLINQAGDVLLMEVKSGSVEIRSEGIFKAYGPQFKNVVGQVSLQYGAIRAGLHDLGVESTVHHLLVVPDAIATTSTVHWPRERILDSTQMGELITHVSAIIGPGLPDEAKHDQVVEFFTNRLHIEPDVSALAGRLDSLHTQLSAGLATWVPRIECPSGVVRVIGTAGSGKTQLALRVLHLADTRRQRAAYFCFNRALADHMGRIAPVRTTSQTWHEFALRTAKGDGLKVDLSLPGAFEQISSHCIQALDQRAADLDLIVLDELQDLQAGWVQALLSRLRPNGKAMLLEDPEQRLYADREEFDIAGAVTITSMENFRSPRVLVQLINALHLTEQPIEPMSAYVGELSEPIVYRGGELQASTIAAVDRCLARGHAVEDIAIISMRGRERSELLGLSRLGPWSLRRFTGRFDADGVAIWDDGELLVDSVRRFKGQAAQAVVLTECDLDELDLLSRRLLFVGLTRPRMHLEWVISERTAQLLTTWVGG